MKLHTFGIVALATLSLSSVGAAQVFNGTTVGGPTFNRTLTGAPPTSLSGVGTAVSYEATPFTVDTSGTYTFLMSAAFDTFALLYTDPFSPATPLTNVLVADDDAGPGSDSQFTINLTAGTPLVFVGTAFSNGDEGAYTLTVSGPGTASFGAVPEPASMTALAVGGLALL